MPSFKMLLNWIILMCRTAGGSLYETMEHKVQEAPRIMWVGGSFY
jgi:hypothetical protein